LGDKHGNVVYLGERECSIQRRHQKVVEEAPSPFVDEELRKAMGEQAVALSQAVGYFSAGTVELIVGADASSSGGFYFLEMNTRLQVEHPVTEIINNMDLVEQMIRVAAGEKLSITQDDVKLQGWSIENRVYAEDPYRGFLPSIGRLVRYAPPETGNGVRVDDGVAEGGEVSIYYDPMIAKLITYADTREEAMDLQIAALDQFVIEGPGHNLEFLSAVMQHPRFRSGDISTAFIAEEYPDGFQGAPASAELLQRLAAIAVFIMTAEADRDLRVSGQLGGRLRPSTEWQVLVGDVAMEATIGKDVIVIDGSEIQLSMAYTPGDTLIIAEFGDEDESDTLAVKVATSASGLQLTCHGAKHDMRVLPAHIARHAVHMIEKTPPDLSKLLICPMPGLLIQTMVEEGEEVQEGQPLAIVEAMKMENVLRAQKTATVTSIKAAVGDSLAVDQIIMELE
jgi:propionyl-CoA carboxylase alpha chain